MHVKKHLKYFACLCLFAFALVPVANGEEIKPSLNEPLAVHVPKAAGVEAQGRDTFVTTEVDRTSVYVGEQLIFRLKFFYRTGVTKASLDDLTGKGFQVKDSKESTYPAVVDGVHFKVREICKLLIPNQAGTITIPGAVIRCEVPEGRGQQSRGLFSGDDFFNFGLQRTEPRILRSRPITLDIRALPQEGRPSSFSGLVGSFTLTTELNKKEIKEGESVTMTMTLTGNGDLSFLPRPAIPGIEQFKSYDEHPVITEKIVNDRVVSVKVFKTALVPLKAGDLSIPEVAIGFFNPETGTYLNASSSPQGLHILPGGGQDMTSVIAGREPASPKQRVQLVGKDILPIDIDIYPLKDETFHPLTWRTCTALLVPPLLYLGILVLRRKRDKSMMDIGFAKSKAAITQARKGIKEAEILAQDRDPKQCYAYLSKTLKIYMGNKLNLAGETKTSDELREALQHRMTEGSLVGQVATLLQELELRRFAPGVTGSEAPRILVQEIQALIEQMEKVL